MGNFYLASELPRGENCHILAVNVLPFWGNPSQAKQEGWWGGSPKRVVEDRQSDWAWGTEYINIRAKTVTHRGPRRPPLVLPEQQLSPQTNALQNDRITREKKPKMCTGWWLPACCIIVIFWYTETDAERKGTGRGRTHPMIGMIVAVSQLFHPTCQSSKPLPEEDQTAECRFK